MSQYARSKIDYTDPNTPWYKTYHLVPDNSNVLDIGCSSGNFGAELIKHKDCVVDGIEINENDIKKAKRKLRNVYKINIETDTLDIKDKYDIVFMGDVIEHLASPISALKRVKKLLKKNGKLVFSMPNITHMSVRLMLLKGNIEYGKTGLLDETHLHFYNSKEIYRVLNTAGYKITVFDYISRDIVQDAIEEELQTMGLIATTKFKELALSLNSVAYQFIGSAVPSQNTSIQKLPARSPKDINDVYIRKWRDEYKKQYKRLEKLYINEKKIHQKSINTKRQIIEELHKVQYLPVFKIKKTIISILEKYEEK